MLGGSTGLYPPDVEPIVKQLLRPTTGSADSPSVLDLGSGSGIWSVNQTIIAAPEHGRSHSSPLLPSPPFFSLP